MRHIYRKCGSVSSAEVFLPGKDIKRHFGTGHDKHTMHCIQKVCPFSRPSDARSSIIYSNVRYGVRSITREVRTDLSSASLVGTGHVPGSSVIARKKLYAHKPNERAKIRWANAWESVSKCSKLVSGCHDQGKRETHVATVGIPKQTLPRPWSRI